MAGIKDANIDLHIHPYIERYGLGPVVEAMSRNSLDVIAAERLDTSIFSIIVRRAKALDAMSAIDLTGLDKKGLWYKQFENGSERKKFILNAGEYNTKENIHVLTVGYSFQPGYDGNINKQFKEIREIIDNALEKDGLVILDHPYVNCQTTSSNITPEKESDIVDLCTEYNGQIAVEWNGYCKPWMRYVLLKMHRKAYENVNDKAEALSTNLWGSEINIPILADTDLHARRKSLLKAAGTSRIIVDIDDTCAESVVKSMKEKIFSSHYENVKRYTGTYHMLRAFCLPLIMDRYKPRA